MKEEEYKQEAIKDVESCVRMCIIGKDNSSCKETGLSSGFGKLDEHIRGFHGGDVIVISGLPSMGKTTFALSIASAIAIDNDTPALFISLEMNALMLTSRIISSVSNIPLNRTIPGMMTEERWKMADRRAEKLFGAPLLIDDSPTHTLESLRETCYQSVDKHHVKAVFIDSLQYIRTDYRANRTRNDDISELMYTIKAMARELDIPFFVVSQMNRYADRREGLEGKRPQLSDLRESGSIEDVADFVLFVHRPEVFHIFQDDLGRDLHDKALIIIAKNRMGRTGEVLMIFRAGYANFMEYKEWNPLSSRGDLISESFRKAFGEDVKPILNDKNDKTVL